MSNSNNTKVKEFYTNDIIYRFDKHKKIIFGVVVDSYEGSSDVDENHTLQKGQIRVLWNNNSREQVWRQSKVRLINRCIIPGDIVRRLENGKETQRGYCKDTKQVATIQIVGTDVIVEHIPSERLHSVRPYDVDDAVCLGNKFGRIETVEQMVSMQSKCGSIVDVLTSINHDLDDYWLSKRNRISFDAYYPGQEVICIPNNFEQPHWIKKSKSMKRNIQTRQRFTVQNVEDVLIEVAWYNNNLGYSNITEISQEDIKKLKVLEHPSDTFLELSDRKLLKLSSGDVLLKKKDWMKKFSLMYKPDVPKVRHIVSCNSKMNTRISKISRSSLVYPANEEITANDEEEWWTEESEESEDGELSQISITKPKKKHYPPKPRDLIPGNTLAVEVICIESKIDVVWQDGTEENDIPSTTLYYSISLDDHEFFPGEWVLHENTADNVNYGVVQYVNSLERTANIKWFTYSDNEKKLTESSMNEMSVYDLKKHSKFVFRPRSIVKSKPTQNDKMGKVVDSCIEGYVKVQWIDGTEENCWPQDIELIPDTSDLDFTDEESSDEDAACVSWETESIESYAGDLSDETVLQNLAARLDFVRNRIIYLRDAFKQHTISETFTFVKDLLLIYENSSYLDKLLGTSYFSLKSKHFQVLLLQAKEKAKSSGIELKGRLFSSDNFCPSISKIKLAEKENINKMIKLENKINAQIEKKDCKESTAPTTPLTPDSTDISSSTSQDNLCLELLSMLKVRMDLAYAEIISRIGGNQALTVLTKASENVATPCSSTPLPSVPTTPDDSFSSLSPLKSKFLSKGSENEPYLLLDEAPVTHHYFDSKFEPTDLQRFLKSVQKEYKLLKDSLPSGVWVRSYSNRIDLLSVLIRGPDKTPYEDGLFLFDIQLSTDYPRSPPIVHYISYSSERLNPNLYVEGKVCISLLGTWMGRGTEVWGPNSTLLQLIVSIQGLILVSEPYYNEAGYEKQTDTQQGYENSRTYNELVILKLIQSMKEMLQSPPETFKREIIWHFTRNGRKLCERLRNYCLEVDPLIPEFPLVPVSKGLKLSLSSALSAFEKVLDRIGDNNTIEISSETK
ncbi:(E3-independent) E2 ubiquitin-conjugating enzyme [Diorhabda sublineata]|uniref:(E3-independent) E2 ubiquitin-conjugating enzyme n=1 Tax=Diorhabda sublineata TaxID=1163346 RepID=UPI0024E06B4A|nr:(E3-independent) E2 ubiquitin-conjugating enzyme [Diorhabda sublineata]